jgi:hypothetical protein
MIMFHMAAPVFGVWALDHRSVSSYLRHQWKKVSSGPFIRVVVCPHEAISRDRVQYGSDRLAYGPAARLAKSKEGLDDANYAEGERLAAYKEDSEINPHLRSSAGMRETGGILVNGKLRCGPQG